MRGSVSWWALALAVLLFWSPLTAQGQSSTPPLPATVQPIQPTTPIESFVSQTLLPLAEKALVSSETSDEDLLTLRQQKIADDEQRKQEQAQRQKEQTDSEARLKAQSDQATKLQTFSDSLLSQLGIFSGTEDEKHAAATKKLGDIQLAASALETQVSVLRIGCITFGVGLGALAIYEGGHALKWW